MKNDQKSKRCFLLTVYCFFQLDKIEGTISTISNATTGTFNNYNIEALAPTNLGILLTGGMSAGLAIGFMKG